MDQYSVYFNSSVRSLIKFSAQVIVSFFGNGFAGMEWVGRVSIAI